MESDTRLVKTLVVAAAWILIVLAVRWVLTRAYNRFEARVAARSPDDAARRRTTFGLLVRLLIAIIILAGVWNVLSLYPQTSELARAMLASSAVLAVFFGLAFSTPLSNLGAGLLVAFSQPLRLGDRVTVSENTGYVEEVGLLFTTLRTDDDRRIFVPNSQLMAGPIVNRTIRDPRRVVQVVLPVRLDASLDAARTLLQTEAQALDETVSPPRVLVTGIRDAAAELTVTVYTPLGADVATVESDLRAACVSALSGAKLLPV